MDFSSPDWKDIERTLAIALANLSMCGEGIKRRLMDEKGIEVDRVLDMVSRASAGLLHLQGDSDG